LFGLPACLSVHRAKRANAPDMLLSKWEPALPALRQNQLAKASIEISVRSSLDDSLRPQQRRSTRPEAIPYRTPVSGACQHRKDNEEPLKRQRGPTTACASHSKTTAKQHIEPHGSRAQQLSSLSVVHFKTPEGFQKIAAQGKGRGGRRPGGKPRPTFNLFFSNLVWRTRGAPNRIGKKRDHFAFLTRGGAFSLAPG
jgi:hypothetical protein